MTTLTLGEQRNQAATDYAAALDTFVAAYVKLAALDRVLGALGFGPPPDVIAFRHAHAAPEFAVDFHERIGAQLAAIGRGR